MRKFFIIVFFFGYVCNSQIHNDYDIFIVLNSQDLEMLVNEKIINDTLIFKSFSFSKKLPKEDFKHSFFINNKGKLIKGLKGVNTHNKDGRVVLNYFAEKKIIKINKLSEHNFIFYKDFLNAEYISFVNVLKKSDRIYVVDLNDNDGVYYKAYEVSLSSY